MTWSARRRSGTSADGGDDLVFARRAQRDISRLDPLVRRRVREALELLATSGNGDVARLQGIDPPEYRLRVGDWRVRFARDPVARTITVLRVLPRGRAYDR